MYILLLVDDKSRYMWLSLLTNKDQAPIAIEKFQAMVEVEYARRLKILHTNCHKEFKSLEFGE